MSEIKIPESLLPENIMETVDKRIETERKKKKRKMMAALMTMGTLSAAAVVALSINVTKDATGVQLGIDEGHKSEALKPGDTGSEKLVLAGELKRAESYDEIYKELDKYNKNEIIIDSTIAGATGSMESEEYIDFNTAESSDDLSVQESVKGESISGGAQNNIIENEGTQNEEIEYSETNTQTEGVDESDVVKTDGKHIYVLSKGILNVLKADGENTKKTYEVSLDDIIDKYSDKKPEFIFPSGDMYISEGNLVIVANGIINSEKRKNEAEINEVSDEIYYMSCDIGYMAGDSYTIIINMKIDGDELRCEKVSYQEGYYVDSRLSNGILYTITNKNITSDKTNHYNIPKVDDAALEAGDICYKNINEDTGSWYVISSMDASDKNKVLDMDAYIADNVQLYVSKDNIYLLDSKYDENEPYTDVVKFSYRDGEIEPVGNAEVEGYVDDQFSADEYKEYLRLVTTGTEEGSNLYVIDKDLKITGKIENIEKNEQVQSARFMGDIGYFVTYENTDPLFAVDLSNPEKPEIVDELKITGFSSYLHFLDESTLMGIGYETDPETGMTENTKLTVFDCSDMTDLKVKNTIQYDSNGYTDATYDHKSILADDKNGIYGFAMTKWEDGGYVDMAGDVMWEDKITYSYYVYSYENGELTEKEVINWEDEDNNDYSMNYIIRGIYAGDYFYIVTDEYTNVYSFDKVMGDEKADKLATISYN